MSSALGPPTQIVDLSALGRDAGRGGGVEWSVSPDGFHTNLVVLEASQVIEPHRNDELDVLFVVLDGLVVLEVDGDPLRATASWAALVPRGAMRSVTAGAEGARYLTIHASRAPLNPRRPTEGVRT
jgi:quercetin dioxygenase-like cupin family protein